MEDTNPDQRPVDDYQVQRSRSTEILRHLTSSSVKRKKVKDSHCKFCLREKSALALVDHLRRSRHCSRLYMRIYKVNTLDNLLLKCFSCEMCGEIKHINFSEHLRRKNECLEGYMRQYKLRDIDEIVKRRKKLKRDLAQSRTTAARKLEYKKKKEKDASNKTTFSSLNDFHKNMMFINYKHCVICRANFGGLSAREIKPNDELNEELDLNSPEKLKMRRFQKFFICSSCQAKKVENYRQNIVNLAEIIDQNEDEIIFFPTQEAVQVLDTETIHQKKIFMMIPTTMEATKLVSEAELSKYKQRKVTEIYQSQNLKRSQLAAIYENEMFKYRTDSNDHFSAIIRNLENKTLSKVEKLPHNFRIPGSVGWMSLKTNEIKARKEQYGNLFLTIKIDLPAQSPNVIATALMNEGIVITADQIGCSTGVSEVKYKVHNHDNSVDCRCESTDLTDLSDYLQTVVFDDSSLKNKHIGTVVSAAQQNLKNFVQDIVKAPGSELFSEKFFFILIFSDEGDSSIVGSLWPRQLDALNLEIAADGKVVDKLSVLKFVDQNFSASTDIRILKSTFNLSDKEASNLSALVLENQHDITSDPELPSLENDVKDYSCCELNVKAAKQLRKYMEERLKSLTIQEKSNLSTFDWLDQVFEPVTGDIEEEDDDEVFTITTADQGTFKFIIDEKLLNLLEKFIEKPLYAAYHYSLTTMDKYEDSILVFKRLHIKDCFTRVFNPFYLQACRSSMTISLGHNSERFDKYLSSSELINHPQGITNSKLLFSHRLVTISEAVYLADKTKKRIVASTRSQYIPARPNRSMRVKEVQMEGPDTFKLEGSHKFFEVVPDYISRHFNKVNGNHLLVETVIWFDFIGVEKSKEVYELFAGNLELIPVSEVESVLGGFLPKFIICRNGDVLQIRKLSKVLLLPNPKSEYEMMYQKCLLYAPIRDEAELQADTKGMYRKINDEGDIIVEVNEKKMFKFKIMTENTDFPEENPDEGVDPEENVDEDVDPSDFALDQLLELL